MKIVKRNNSKSVININDFRKKTALTNAKKLIKPSVGLQMSAIFDITGSMFGNFDLVREKMGEIITMIDEEIKRAEFSIMAFRNHGDEKYFSNIYYSLALTTDVDKIRDFMSGIEKGGGGSDALTCMEECLREANLLHWRRNCPKALVVIGDMPPHGVLDSISKCPNEINYEYEIEELKNKGVRIYSIFCGHYEKVKIFYMKMASKTGGKFLELKDIDFLSEILIGIAMHNAGKLKEFMIKMKKIKQLPEKAEKVLKLLE